MGHKARPKKSTKVGSNPPPPPSASTTERKDLAAVAALAEKVRHPIRPNKKRHGKIKQGNAFGKEDLADWRNGAGRAKSWKLPKPGRTHHSSHDLGAAGDAKFLIDMVLAGVTVTQVLRPALPVALLKRGVRWSEGQLVNVRSMTSKSRASHRIRASTLDSDWGPTIRKRWYPVPPPAERFIFTQKVGHAFLGGWLFEEYVVKDVLLQHCHLVGFTLHKVHLDNLEDVCREDLGISHIAHRFFVVGGFWKLAVVGKRLEEPSIFTRYRAGTMTARVRRYFEDFPKPGSSTGGEPEEQLVSDFVAGLEESAARKKKKTRMVKQRMKRREKRAEASSAKQGIVTVAKENPVKVE